MATGVKHYLRDGKMHKGATHKHPDGTMMSGAKMSASAKKLYHFGGLNKAGQKKARTQWS
jgi:hypothetical protein